MSNILPLAPDARFRRGWRRRLAGLVLALVAATTLAETLWAAPPPRRVAKPAPAMSSQAPDFERWEALGRRALQIGGDAEFQQYQKDRREAPGVGPMSPTLVCETLRLLYAEQRWEELRRFLESLGGEPTGAPSGRPMRRPPDRPIHAPPLPFLSGNPRLLPWMRQHVLESPATAPALSRPLAVPLNKAAATMFQELRAAVADKEYETAARMLSNSLALRDDGLIAVPGDWQLLVSCRVMPRIVCRQPGVAEAMGRRLDEAARLGIQQTLAQGDPAAIEALTVQFHGTPAHALACRWLGDRALTGADFRGALAWYEEGARAAPSAAQLQLAARVRLASAWLGHPRGQPPAEAVLFGESRLSPEQFEHRVRDALAKQPKAQTASPGDALPVLPFRQSVAFRFVPRGGAERRGQLDLPAGRAALLAADDLLIVSTRQGAIAIDAAAGATRWRWDMGSADAPHPIRPLVQGQRVYLRTMVVPQRYGVVCLDARSGRELWRRDCGDAAIGEPQLIQGRLYVPTFRAPGGDRGPARAKTGTVPAVLGLVELEPKTGDVTARRAITEIALGETASDRPPECQAAPAGNRLILLFCGAAVCLDPQGKVVWLRDGMTIPDDIDAPSPLQLGQPPRVVGDRVYVQQPGSCAVECLAVETGELVWRRGIVGLQEILDVRDEQLLVRSAYGLTAVEAATGRVLWRQELPDMLTAVARNAAGQILCARRLAAGNPGQLLLLWLEAASGETKAHSLLPPGGRGPIALGPIAVCGERAWCCGEGLSGSGVQPAAGLHLWAIEAAGPATEGDAP